MFTQLSDLSVTHVLAGTVIALSTPFIIRYVYRICTKNGKNKAASSQSSSYKYPNIIDLREKYDENKTLNEYFNENYEKCLIEWCQKYPIDCTLVFGENLKGTNIRAHKIILLNSIEAIKKYDNLISNRPTIFAFDAISHHFLGSFFRMYDANLLEIRKTSLYGLQRLVLNNPESESLVNDELEQFIEFINEKVIDSNNTENNIHSNSGIIQNIRPYLQQLIVNIIFRVSIDARFDYSLDNDTPIKKQMKYMSDLLNSLNMVELSKINSDNASSDNYKNTISYVTNALNSMYDFLKNAIVSYKKNKYDDDVESSNSDDKIDTFADLLIKKQKEELKKKLNLKSNDNYSDDDIIVQVFTVFLATCATTGFTLEWALYYLSKDQNLQESLEQEIRRVSGSGNFVAWKSRSKMLFTEAFLNEILRLSSTQAIIPRATNEEVKIDDLFIPANSTVLINTFGIHHNPENWSNANFCEPSRWFNDDGKSLKANKNMFLPFGSAPRSCIGDTLSKTLIFSIISNLINRFEFEYITENPEATGNNEGKLGVMRCPHNFDIKIKQRF